jgi:transposase
MLMVHARGSARRYGKFDPDQRAEGRACRVARTPCFGPLGSTGAPGSCACWWTTERARCFNRPRWHVHGLDPSSDLTPRLLTRVVNLDAVITRLEADQSLRAAIAVKIASLMGELAGRDRVLEGGITGRVVKLVSYLLALFGVGALTAAKIVAETADVLRFQSEDAFACHQGTAALPVWSGSRERHRLSRTGNRQLNAAFCRVAITHARYHRRAIDFLKRRAGVGNMATEARRAVERRLSDVVYRTLLLDAPSNLSSCVEEAV